MAVASGGENAGTASSPEIENIDLENRCHFEEIDIQRRGPRNISCKTIGKDQFSIGFLSKISNFLKIFQNFVHFRQNWQNFARGFLPFSSLMELFITCRLS